MSETTGTDLIRNALFARNAKVNLANFGRDMNLNANQIHAFIFQDASLPADKLQAICHYLWAGNTEYDPVNDRLRPAKRDEPKPQGILPTLDMELPKYRAGPAGRGPQPTRDTPTPVKSKVRPGWLGGW